MIQAVCSCFPTPAPASLCPVFCCSMEGGRETSPGGGSRGPLPVCFTRYDSLESSTFCPVPLLCLLALLAISTPRLGQRESHPNLVFCPVVLRFSDSLGRDVRVHTIWGRFWCKGMSQPHSIIPLRFVILCLHLSPKGEESFPDASCLSFHQLRPPACRALTHLSYLK